MTLKLNSDLDILQYTFTPKKKLLGQAIQSYSLYWKNTRIALKVKHDQLPTTSSVHRRSYSYQVRVVQILIEEVRPCWNI